MRIVKRPAIRLAVEVFSPRVSKRETFFWHLVWVSFCAVKTLVWTHSTRAAVGKDRYSKHREPHRMMCSQAIGILGILPFQPIAARLMTPKQVMVLTARQ